MRTITDLTLANMAFHPRNGASDGYPYDLDGSNRNVRPRTGIDRWPTPVTGAFARYGSMNAILPLQNAFTLGQAFGKVPFGPIMSIIPDNLQWQITVPGLNKYQPQY